MERLTRLDCPQLTSLNENWNVNGRSSAMNPSANVNDAEDRDWEEEPELENVAVRPNPYSATEVYHSPSEVSR